MKELREYIRQVLLEADDCWDGYSPGAQSGVKTKISAKTGKRVNNCEKIKEDESSEDLLMDEADTPNKDKMKCNKPRYIRNMRNNSDKPKNRKSFRARHNCDKKDDNMAAGYWACKDW